MLSLHCFIVGETEAWWKSHGSLTPGKALGSQNPPITSTSNLGWRESGCRKQKQPDEDDGWDDDLTIEEPVAPKQEEITPTPTPTPTVSRRTESRKPVIQKHQDEDDGWDDDLSIEPAPAPKQPVAHKQEEPAPKPSVARKIESRKPVIQKHQDLSSEPQARKLTQEPKRTVNPMKITKAQPVKLATGKSKKPVISKGDDDDDWD